VLQLSRTIEFEPATDPGFSPELCLEQAANCFQRGVPAVVSVHSINFHSTIRDFRSPTLKYLEDFFSALESKHAGLLYLRDEDLYDLVQTGSFKTEQGTTQVNVVKKNFTRAFARRAV
jgi:hypothetical protein